jgi:hypothetical protein
MIVVPSGKLADQLFDVLGSVRQEKVEAVLAVLRVATTHQPHRMLEPRGHVVKVPSRIAIVARAYTVGRTGTSPTQAHR